MGKVFEEVVEKFMKPFSDTNIIYVMVPSEESWDLILELVQKNNFSLGDAFHVDAAVGNKCNIFISNDSDLVKMINETKLIAAARPAELDKKLSELGIRCTVK